MSKFTPKAAEKINQYLMSITPYGFSGAVLVANKQGILLNRGYGLADRNRGLPNTAGTVFDTGSVTKQFTAAGIMKLKCQGRLSTDDLLSKYIIVPDEKQSITLHHLLTHTSGIVDSTGDDYAPAEREEVIGRILGHPLDSKPGQEYRYANDGYSLLAMIIEDVSGRGYEEFIRTQLLLPSGMKNTGYVLPDWSKSTLARGYSDDQDYGSHLDHPYAYWNLIGAGGILSTTTDLWLWHQALIGEGILPQSAKEKMYTPFLDDYGYGWEINDTDLGRVIQHNGTSVYGTSCEFRRYFDHEGVLILFCNQSLSGFALAQVLGARIEGLLQGEELKLPPSPIDLPSNNLAGTFRLGNGGSIEASLVNGCLRLKAQDQQAINALLDLSLDSEAEIELANKMSKAIVLELLKGGYSKLRSCYAHDEPRFLRVIALISHHLGHLGDDESRVSIALTLLSARIPGALETSLTVSIGGEQVHPILFWISGKVVAFGFSMFIHPMVYHCLPTEQGWYGYNVLTGMGIKVDMKEDNSGTRLFIGDSTTAVKTASTPE